MKYWWKILSIVLLIYVFLAGLLVPLKPGIIEVTPNRVRSGRYLDLKVKGYNANYTAKIRAWLKYDSTYAMPAQVVGVDDPQHLSMRFYIPQFLPDSSKVKDMTLVIDNEVDGACVLPSAVFVSQDSMNPARMRDMWESNSFKNLSKTKHFAYPFRNILAETIRNLFFHVPLWFGMIILFSVSLFYSWRYLKTLDRLNDIKAVAFTKVGVLYGILGLITGAIWAKETWGAFWSWDVKQNMAAICMLIYGAYFVLRGSFEDDEKRARIGAVYGIFAYAAMIPLLFVIPRMTDSLHPGNGGNPGLGKEDLDNTMRVVFYPAIIGWTLLGAWLADISWRIERLRAEADEA